MTLVPSEQESILGALGLNPRDPRVQALALVANRYNLDLILKHVFLIQGTVYVSHAGLLHLAHTSGDLDGIEVECREDDKRFVATAKIYRKSMSRPFVYTDECYKNEAKVADKRKRAITRAERNALRRAFDVGVDVYEEDRPEPPIKLSPHRPEIPRRSPTTVGALPVGEEQRSSPGAAPSPTGPPEGPTEAWKSVVIRARQMGLSEDERHAVVWYATNGRTGSSKELTPTEAGECHKLLHILESTGEKPWPESSPTKSISSSPPSTESPAPTGTPSKDKPSGDAA